MTWLPSSVKLTSSRLALERFCSRAINKRSCSSWGKIWRKLYGVRSEPIVSKDRRAAGLPVTQRLGNLMAAVHDRLGEIELTVKLKRARLNRQRTRRRTRFTRF